MQPSYWRPPVELSVQEEQIVARIRRTKLFVLKEQGVQIDEHGQAHLIKGVAIDRRISIEEALFIELRERQQTLQGRNDLRERVAVEHSLVHVGRWQGRRARYRGIYKNLFDLRRCAVVHNLHVLVEGR
ncbi:hypothetical protein KSX_68610 [Ktedonospora formicarum]|uniref:Transposase n=1 Tax=Ktedonospora formicarum TaxID=2778364 RepID=A0A8J3I7S7_9CHLR|nr:hypothetical protein KSX_68610 [Ktedonospora formicarum]